MNEILDNNRANGQKIVHCHGIFDILQYWTKGKGIAVGSKGFVEHVKSAFGALAKGRKAKGSGDSYQLREPSAPYGEHFWVKNEDIGLKNTYLGNFNPE